MKSFFEGGLTVSQVDGLFAMIQKAKKVEFEIQARLHGCEIEGDSSSSNSPSVRQPAEHPNVPMFGDPSKYEHMSEDERETETQRMMGKHKLWSGDGNIEKAKI